MSERYTEIKWLQRRRQCWCRMPVVMVVALAETCAHNLSQKFENKTYFISENVPLHRILRVILVFAPRTSRHTHTHDTHIRSAMANGILKISFASSLPLPFIAFYYCLYTNTCALYGGEGGWTSRKMYLCLVPLLTWLWLENTHTHALTCWWLVILLNNIHYSNPQKPNKLCVSIACSFNEVSESEWCARVTCSSACT